MTNLKPKDGKVYFQLHDLGCAAALLTDNFKLARLDRTNNPKKVLFCFEQEEDLNQAIENYFSCSFQVDAQTYFNILKTLKNRIYSNL